MKLDFSHQMHAPTQVIKSFSPHCAVWRREVLVVGPARGKCGSQISYLKLSPWCCTIGFGFPTTERITLIETTTARPEGNAV